MMLSEESGIGRDGDGTLAQAKRDALRFLAYRARSEAEVRRRLGKNYPSDVIGRVIDDLKKLRYVDDIAFAREWRKRRERKGPRSAGVLRQELLGLGVETEAVREALEGFDAGESAYRAARPLSGKLKDTEFPIFRRRLWSYLQRRGYDGTAIDDVVSRLWRELADPLDGGVDAETEK